MSNIVHDIRVEKGIGPFPTKPRSLEDTGLAPSFLIDHALKTIYVQGLTLGSQLVDALKLPFENVVDVLLDYLRRDALVEIVGSADSVPASYEYVITDTGQLRARELMDVSHYTGPAPVSLSAYIERVNAQSILGQGVPSDEFTRSLAHLVLSRELLDQLGPAINAGKPIFIFGNTGNGKTTIGLAIGAMWTTPIWIPYAISVHGQVIRVFDPLVHHPIADDSGIELAEARKGLLRRIVPTKQDARLKVRNRELVDERWTRVSRPLIVGGGEMTLKDLDLVFDPIQKFYEAPHQMKANGGVFLVDDLGRQKVSAREILNRWILPMEKRTDRLTVHLGGEIELPFDTLLVFATNLDPADVADETFLRRLRYKLHIKDPSWDAYTEIFRREAGKRGLAYSDEGMQYLIREHYQSVKREPRGVHPRDILDELLDIAKYRGVAPTMSNEMLDLACEAYFLNEETSGQGDE